ncbi:uncharacterized protein LOC127093527 [Lathyrus oleraceus]|uniref:Pheromone receptor-like protein n=1 Tax=Pisum sativum TaxID=3888 RepID=A0A9D5A2K6_PEA|nr:uncharacterized protein LOC127093527 [Pisum sativum]KAI5393096.1 hypothetical protein KIW84_060294 [Pisum sativum]
MEVMIQSSKMETFNFSNGTMSSPYLSPPSSPKRFGEYYLSAPSSPSRLSELYSQIDYLSIMDQTSSTSKKNNNVVVDDDDVYDHDDEGGGFAFFVNHDESKNMSTRSAEELFHGGKIKPFEETKVVVEPRKQQNNVGVGFDDERRGRERERTKGTDSSLNNSGRRVTRSHSPYRKSNYTFELEEQNFQQKQQPRMIKEESKSSSSKGSRRWKLSDLLLFRSASEGRGSNKDPLKKHFVGYKKNNNNIEEVKGSSFRSSESFSNNGLRKKGQVSAHEMHYAMKKAESQDMKKRTFLPYRQGILGRLSGFGL